MAKVRAEHDAVFKSVEDTAAQLRKEPHLLNRIPYTTAVIKEAMRLFPPASAMRGGEPGKQLSDDRGNLYNGGYATVDFALSFTAASQVLALSSRIPSGALACWAGGPLVSHQGRMAAVRTWSSQLSWPDLGYARCEDHTGSDGARI